MLRAPLDRSSGELRAETTAYPAALTAAVLPTETLSAAERLATYHRQYWFRLFTVLQGLYPLTARLLGYWHFNDFAARHLGESPPSGFDIDTVGAGFDDSLARYLVAGGVITKPGAEGVPAAAVVEAARVDAGFHRITRAARSEPFVPSADDATRLGTSRLRLSPSVALLSESWSLAEQRLGLAERPSVASIPLGLPLPATRHWLLARRETKLGLVALEPQEALLFAWVQRLPLVHALGMLEAAAAEAERASLPARAQAWLARSVQLGVWAGLEQD